MQECPLTVVSDLCIETTQINVNEINLKELSICNPTQESWVLFFKGAIV